MVRQVLSLASMILILVFSGIFATASVTQASSLPTSPENLTIWIVDTGLQGNFLKERINNFTQQNNQINVTIMYKDPATVVTEYLLGQLSGTDPDIFQVYNDWIPFLALKDSIKNLDSVITDQNAYLPNALRGMKGITTTNMVHLYAYPQSVDTVLFFYNQKMYQSLGITVPKYNELWNWTAWNKAVLTSSNATDPTNIRYGLGLLQFPDTFEPFIYGMGGQLFSDSTIDRSHLVAGSDIIKFAFNFTHQLEFFSKAIPPLDAKGNYITKNLVMFGSNTTIRGLFGNFTVVSQLLKGNYTATFGTNLSNLGITQIPRLNTVGTGAPLIIKGLALNPGLTGSKLEAAEALTTFLTSEDTMLAGLENYLYLPARASVYSNSTILNNSIVQGFKYGIGRAYQTPISQDWITARSTFGNIASLYMQGKIDTDASAVLRLENSILSPVTFSYPVIRPVSMPEDFRISGDSSQQIPASAGVSGFSIFSLILTCTVFGIIIGKRKYHI